MPYVFDAILQRVEPDWWPCVFGWSRCAISTPIKDCWRVAWPRAGLHLPNTPCHPPSQHPHKQQTKTAQWPQHTTTGPTAGVHQPPPPLRSSTHPASPQTGRAAPSSPALPGHKLARILCHPPRAQRHQC